MANASVETVLPHITFRDDPDEEQLPRTRFKSESAVRAALQKLHVDSRNLLKLHFAKGLNGLRSQLSISLSDILSVTSSPTT